jgi:hypothetical protein
VWFDAITAYFCAAFSRLAAAVAVGLNSPIVSLELAFGIITTKCPVVLLLSKQYNIVTQWKVIEC